MISLKKYQRNAIDVLKEYLKEVEKVGPRYAFMGITETAYKSEFFEKIPFICMKLPTGAGKTLVGCHSVGEVMNSFLKHKLDKGIVLWFTPSEAIKSQTLRKFKDRKDMHRIALDEAFDNKIRVFSNEEALKIRKADVQDNLCLVISSLEAFRKEKSLQNKYKVYQENGALIDHFENIQTAGLEKDEQGTIISSLANVVKMNNPFIVIDEGHKTKTKLSIEFLRELNPSFILEYTATPRQESNVLVNIHSSELKEEQMVKLPIVLESSAQWQQTIQRGVLRREELEKLAQKNKLEYLRPIALLQAESDKENEKDITVQKIRDFLIKERKIAEEEIAVVYRGKNELDGVNLFDKKCKIKYIITVSALAEGWDCSFAYVLISVANIGSKIAVEQIIGRILRMPNAKTKEIEDLNRSYVFASARNFNEAANQIIGGLEDNGYSKYDIINASGEKKTYELEIKRRYKEDFSVPMMVLDDESLSFEDLIGNDFKLLNQDYKFEFKSHYDSDGRILIDIKKDDKWQKEVQQVLNLGYKDKNFSKEELLQWLDKKLRFILLEKEDKVGFLKKAIDYQLTKYSLSELSVNRYVLCDKLSEVIGKVLENFSKERFDKFMKKGTIKTKQLESYPETIIIGEEIPQTFSKNYYEKIESLNKEEQRFIERVDSLPNIKFWVRNREKKDPFYIQGWKKGKFYPDFVALTNRGNILVLEWKGEDRMSNEDTEYKDSIGKIWENQGKHQKFFIVNNKNVEEVILKIKEM